VADGDSVVVAARVAIALHSMAVAVQFRNVFIVLFSKMALQSVNVISVTLQHECETLQSHGTNRLPIVLRRSTAPGLDRRARRLIEARGSTAADYADSVDAPALVEFHP
jgi:hypothetical protein